MTRLLSTKIQNNQAAYLKHQIEIETLYDQLKTTTAELHDCRKLVKNVQLIADIPLEIMHKSRQRERVNNIKEVLHGLRTLIQLEQTLNELLRRSDYTEAIKLMLNCKNIGLSFQICNLLINYQQILGFYTTGTHGTFDYILRLLLYFLSFYFRFTEMRFSRNFKNLIPLK